MSESTSSSSNNSHHHKRSSSRQGRSRSIRRGASANAAAAAPVVSERERQHDNNNHHPATAAAAAADEEEPVIVLTPSADGILNVTPVNSYAMDSPITIKKMTKLENHHSSSSFHAARDPSSQRQEQQPAPSRQPQAPAQKLRLDPSRFKNSLADTEKEEEEDDQDARSRSNNMNKQRRRQQQLGVQDNKNDDDEEEEEDDENDNQDEGEGDDRVSMAQSDATSEWDKALRIGKSNNKGDASDFFAVPSHGSSTIDDESDVGIETSLTSNHTTTEGGDPHHRDHSAASLTIELSSSGGAAGGGISTTKSTASSAYYHNDKNDLPPPCPSVASSASNARSSHTVATTSSAAGPSMRAAAAAAVGSALNSVGSSTTTATTTNASSVAAMLVPTSSSTLQQHHHQQQQQQHNDHIGSGVLPDVLMTMRQKLESLTMFDSDMMRLAAAPDDNDPMFNESRESLKRSSQQSISAAVLVSLAHKRYERRRLAAMEIEKVVRSLVQQGELERIRAILLLLSDDYVRSTSEDARKGGVVALAACAIGMKKVKDDGSTSTTMANGTSPTLLGGGGESQKSLVQECRDLILASVVHACQDHSQRVRYYACENLCNTVKVIPILAIQHFFILFEILRSLYADVSVDVRKGAEILDRKIKDIVVAALNSGALKAEACIPVFARFVYSRHKPTKRLTLTWLQEWSEKLIGSPILEYLHLFLGGIFDMIGDPTVAIRQSALAFLQSVLPKLLTLEYIDDTPMEEGSVVNFDKILQSLVTTMEHPNPFVRKVAMYWMSRIVKAHIGDAAPGAAGSVGKSLSNTTTDTEEIEVEDTPASPTTSPNRRVVAAGKSVTTRSGSSAASVSVRNSVPHVLPGILLSIGDTYDPTGAGASNHPSHHNHNIKNSFLPDQTTRALAEQTNASLQEAVRRDGSSFVQHLDGFIIALREELDSPGGLLGKNAPAVERSPYRTDVNHDGSGIESPGWFRGSYNNSDIQGKERAGGGGGSTDDAANNVTATNNSSTMVTQSRLCALHWVIVLYQYVVPDLLKADYAREFIYAIINQLVDDPPQRIVYKSLEVLAIITVPVSGEESLTASAKKFVSPSWAVAPSHRSHHSDAGGNTGNDDGGSETPVPVHMTQSSIDFALDILGPEGRQWISRDRQVFSALIQMHSTNPELVADLTSVISYMCKLQPAEFVIVSFAVELDQFVLRKRRNTGTKELALESDDPEAIKRSMEYAKALKFVSSFVQHMNHVLLNAEEAQSVREVLKDCCVALSSPASSERDRRRCRIFHILLHSWAHNLGAVVSLCLWSGAFRTASLFLHDMNPLDVNLMFLLEIDRLVELLERPLFRHLNVRMLEHDHHHSQHNLYHNHHLHPLDHPHHDDDDNEGSGTMLFRALKSLLMILPQSTSYRVLAARLNSIARFRQSTNLSIVAAARQQRWRAARHLSSSAAAVTSGAPSHSKTELFVNRVLHIRAQHCQAEWQAIRAASLETPKLSQTDGEHGSSSHRSMNTNKTRPAASWHVGNDERGNEGGGGAHKKKSLPPIPNSQPKEEERWKSYWSGSSGPNNTTVTVASSE